MITKKTFSFFTLLALSTAYFAANAQSVSVNLSSGQPTYSKPLIVPPGVGAFTPELTLSYAGFARQSHYGVGWQLEGLSEISRCGTTLPLDGKQGSARNSVTDKLCLDGQRLIPTTSDGIALPLSLQSQDASGLPSGAFSEFRLEKDSNTRIRAYGSANGQAGGPAYFRVWHPDGTISDYGNGPYADANTNALGVAVPHQQSNAIAFSWKVSRMSDVSGNFIDFKYQLLSPTSGTQIGNTPVTGWESILKEIQYSNNKIVFQYVDKVVNGGLNDAMETFLSGIKVTNTKNLASITTYVNAGNTASLGVLASAVPVRTYKLGYDYGQVPVASETLASTGRTRLANLTDCFGGPSSTKCLRPVNFEYSLGTGRNMAPVASADFSLSGIALVPKLGKEYGALLLDFDGDGRTDILRWSSDKLENKLYRSTGVGGFTTVSNTMLTTLQLGGHPCFSTSTVDVNGDGLLDLFVYAPSSGKGDDGITTCSGPGSYFLKNESGTGVFTQVAMTGATPARIVSKVTEIAQPRTSTYTEGRNFYFGDFTGDGKVDLLTSTLPAFTWTFSPPEPTPCFGKVCTQLYRGNGNGTFTPMTTNIAEQTYYDLTAVAGATRSTGPSPMLRDFNGDGKMDLFVGHRWSFGGPPGNVILSNGDGTFEHRSFMPFCETSSYSYPCYMGALDYNGDGNLDVFVGAQEGNTNKLYLGGLNDTSFIKVSNFNLDSYYYQLFNGSGSVTVGIDMNQDGMDDLLRLGSFAGSPPMENVLWLSKGDGTFEVDTGFAYSLQQTVMRKPDGSVDTLMGNFTGLGGMEFIVATATGNTLYVKSNRGLPDKLVAVTDVYGKRTEITHVPLAHPRLPDDPLGMRYVSDRGTTFEAQYPKIDLTPPSQMSVVARISRPSGVDATTLAEDYAYGGLKYDTEGAQWLGFRTVKVQRPAANGEAMTIRTLFSQVEPAIGLIAQEDSYLGTLTTAVPSQPLGRKYNFYCDTADSEAEKTAAAQEMRNCAPASRVLKKMYPHLVRTTGVELDGTVLPITTIKSSVNPNGAVTNVETTVTLGGNEYKAIRATTYYPDETSCTSATACRWAIGRRDTVTERRVVPNSLPTVTAGSGRYATALDGGSTSPAIAVSPTSLSFAGRVVGSTSAAQTVTVTNTGSSTLRISQTAVTGDFVRSSNTCSNVAAGATCTVGVKFSPTATGTRTGSLTLTHNANPTTTTVALSGVGSGYAASIADVSFGPVRVGQTLNKTAVLKNSGSSSITVTAPTAASVTGTDMSFVSTTCSTSLAANASCNIVVRFGPTASTSRSGVLTVVTSGGTAVADLSGTGVIGVPTVSVSALAFGNQQVSSTSTPKSVRLTNTGTDTLTVSSVSAAAQFVVTTNECTALEPQQYCDVYVAFAPTASGSKAGQLTMATNGSPADATVNLSGSGVNLLLSPSVTSLSFGEVQTDRYKDSSLVTLSNGSAFAATGLTILTPYGYQLVNNTCGTSLAASASCTFKVRFAPTEVNAHNGNVLIRSLGKEVTVAVTGTGRAPSVALGSGVLGSVPVKTSRSHQVSVQNTGVGPVDVTIPDDAVTGAGFSYGGTTCGATLAAGASCSVTVNFTFPIPGQSSGSLKMYTYGTLKVVPLAATATGSILITNSGNLSFGTVSVGSNATSALVSVYNSGNAISQPLSVTATGDYSITSDTCSNAQLQGEDTDSCTFKVRFQPTAAGTRSGTVTVTDGVSTRALSATGTGAAAVLAVAPSSVSFGSVYVGQTKDSATVTVTNSGTVTATGLTLTPPTGFSIVSNGCGASLAASGTCTFKVRFSPTQESSYSGNVNVNSTSAATVTKLTVSGTGSRNVPAVTIAPTTTMAFGQVYMGQYAEDTFTVTNSGSTATGLSFSVTSPGYGNFTIVTTTGTTCVQGGSLSSGASCTVRILFAAPCTAGNASGTFTMSGTNFSALSRSMTASVPSTNQCQ